MGLAEEANGRTFTGLVDTRRRDVAALLAEAANAGPSIEEVRVRRPGLDLLLSRLTTS
jgi:hypothetical protein